MRLKNCICMTPPDPLARVGGDLQTTILAALRAASSCEATDTIPAALRAALAWELLAGHALRRANLVKLKNCICMTPPDPLARVGGACLLQFLQLYELPAHVQLQIQFLQLCSDLIRNSQTRKSQFFMPFTGSLPQLGGI